MDPSAFAIVRSEVVRLPHIDDKIQAIVYAQGNFYAEQVGELLASITFDDEKSKALQSCVAKMLPATCIGVFPILRVFRSDRSRVQALQLVAGYVTDPKNYASLNELFPYAQEREYVRGIMTNRLGAPPMAPTYGQQTVGNPYPYGRPRPRIDPNDPCYQLVDKTVDAVASGVASILAPRRSAGMVLAPAQPGAVVYQTTTYNTGYPGTTFLNPPRATVIGAGPGVHVVTTGVTQPGVQYISPQATYPRQQYYQPPPQYYSKK